MGAGLVTVAFVDIVRSTELLNERGDAERLAAIESTLAVVRERIETYGGREVKPLGDGWVLVFPAPRQAVAFAVATQRALLGRIPTLRIGVATGEVTPSADDPVGGPVDAAVRIAAKAAGGEVLVSDVVRQLVATIPGVRFVDRGRDRVQGLADRWRLFGAEGSETALDSPPVFGRAAELTALDWLLHGPVDGGGRTLVFEGEAGIGKTHLAETARCHAIAAGMRVLAARADELEQDRPGRLLLGLADELGVSLTALLDDPHHAGGSHGFAVIEAIGDALEDAAVEVPIVVVVEDLQWADELSLRGLAAAARRVASLPVALLVTLRPSPRPPLLGRVLAAFDDTTSQRLRIERLDDVAVTSLIAALTGAPPGPTLARRIGGAAGNPLYVIELLRALDEDGALHIHGGVADVDDDRRLPATLRHTIVQRLSSLSADTMEVLRGASLLGREFRLTDLATVIGRPVVEVASRLRAPVDIAVLSGAGDSLSFRHDLIRDAVYDDIPPAIRRDLHTAAGQALASTGAPVAQVAQQLALGARLGDILAVEWLVRAANATLTLDLPSTVSLFEQALRLAGPDWAGRDRVEIELLEPLAACGRVGEARSRAAALLDRGVDATQEFAVRRGLAVVSALAGDIASAVAENEAAAAVPGAPPGEAAILRCLAANMSLITGRAPADVRPTAQRALADAQRGGATASELACVAHQTLALAAGIEGRYEEAADHARTSRRLLFANPIPSRGFLIPEQWEAAFLLHTDRFDAGIATLEKARSRAQRRGESGMLVHSHFTIGMVHFLTGRWDDAVSELEAGLAVARDTGNQAHVIGSHALLGRIALGRGNLRDAEIALAASQRALTDGGHLFDVDLLYWAQARLLEANGDPAGARAVLAAAWDQTASLRGLLQYRILGPDLARLARAGNDTHRARSVAEDMERIAAATAAPSASAAALRARGLAEDDVDTLIDAVVRYRQSPRRLDLASACEDAGRVSLRRADRATAVALLDESASIFLDCGAAGDLARVDSVLRAHNIRRRRHGPACATHGWDALSPTELKVVELVAQGLSNPQIAATLFISRRTVETHVAHIFGKLAVSSRARLAAVAASHTHQSISEPSGTEPAG